MGLLEAIKEHVVPVAAQHAADVDAKGRFPIETLQALQKVGAMSAAVPVEFGGPGHGLRDLGNQCAAVAAACGSSGMVLAMHHIQVATIARHCRSSEALCQYLRDLVKNQWLIGSITSEVGTWGSTRTSICALERDGDKVSLAKEATTGSYAAQSDSLLITCRRQADSGPSDQIIVLFNKDSYTLKQTTTWDTMGMRGTVSPGFSFRGTAPAGFVVPGLYADSSAQSMVPYSHTLWSALWTGIAGDAVARVAALVRADARRNPGVTPPNASRLAKVNARLQVIRQHWGSIADEFDRSQQSPNGMQELQSMAWALKFNNLKTTVSETAVKVVHHALQIAGIQGFKNDSPTSLSRHYRDLLSASLMVSNERIADRSAGLLLVYKDDGSA